MGRSGWAYTDLGYFNELGGMTGSVQFRTDCNSLSGSTNFVFATSSNRVGIREDLTQSGFDIQRGSTALPLYHPNAALEVRGDMNVTGSIYAKNYYIQNVSFMDFTGSTKFGDSSGDYHSFTGSVSVSEKIGIGLATPEVPLHLYAAATTATTPHEVLRLQITDEGVDMNAGGGGPSIDFYVGETSGQNFGGLIGVIREEASDVDSDAAMVFHTTTDDQGRGNDREKMRITSVGKVGIGTTSPTDLLTVAADLSSGTDAGIHIAADGDDDAYIDLTEQGGSSIAAFGASDAYGFRIVYDGGSGVEALQVKSGNEGTVNARITIKRDTGNIGIGVTDPDTALEILNTSSQLKLSYDGSQATAFTVDNGGDLKIVPSGGEVIIQGNLIPNIDDGRNLGSASKRWAHIYTGDLHLKNERGDWTMVEEADYLTLVNNSNGKKYKIMMEEIED